MTITSQESRAAAAPYGIIWTPPRDGSPVGHWSITCACGARNSKAWAPARPIEQMLKQFRRADWSVYHNRNPVCPDCIRPERKEITMTPGVIKLTPLPTPATGPSLKLMHTVFTKLDEVFEEGKGRYLPDWSDEKVADATGASLAFVIKARLDVHGELVPVEDAAVVRMRDELELLRMERDEIVKTFDARIAFVATEFEKFAAARKIGGR